MSPKTTQALLMDKLVKGPQQKVGVLETKVCLEGGVGGFFM